MQNIYTPDMKKKRPLPLLMMWSIYFITKKKYKLHERSPFLFKLRHILFPIPTNMSTKTLNNIFKQKFLLHKRDCIEMTSVMKFVKRKQCLNEIVLIIVYVHYIGILYENE